MFLSKKSLQHQVKLLPIDFKKPWWQLIADQKWLVLRITLFVGATHAFWFATPFLIEHIFESPSLLACALFFIAWIAIDCLHAVGRQMNAEFQLQCIHSIYQNTHQQLLTIDPRYHVHRSSGAILGKIDRCARGYEDLLDHVTHDFLPLFMGIIVMLIALSWHSLLLAFIMGLFCVAMVTFGYYFARYACQKWEKGFISTDDDFKSVAVENLAQVQLVRASFASDYISHKLTHKIETNMKTEGDLWISYITTSFIINMLYLASIIILISALAWQLNLGIITIPAALGLAVAYIQGTKSIISITKQFRCYIRGWVAVKDLFEFMANFGKQSFPVLGDKTISIPVYNTTSIIADHFSFNYETAKLFNSHSFQLTCSATEENKLFGIIGASGSGKTTLLSILGGQLKPDSGTVKINDIDIYAINDATRRSLIALQGQTATNVKGTVKYNLLFGLPEHSGFTDHELLTILQRVGLLNILESHNGLETMLGEGGLNLSGGQRQRLNFASLYLRAQYYKPVLILIDEPTSSLDEISESAITQMIQELAQSAITLVIAHRLKTVQKAVGLIDLSLLDEDKSIKALKPEELEQRSEYYRKLIQGKMQLDS